MFKENSFRSGLWPVPDFQGDILIDLEGLLFFRDDFRNDLEGLLFFRDGFRNDLEGLLFFRDGFRNDLEGFLFFRDGFRNDLEGLLFFRDGFWKVSIIDLFTSFTGRRLILNPLLQITWVKGETFDFRDLVRM